MTSNNQPVSIGQAVKITSMAQLERIMKVVLFTPMGNIFSRDDNPQFGAPAVIVSDPGVGKTAATRALARRMRQTVDGERVPVELLSFEPGAMGEAAVGVTPVPIRAVIDGREMTVMQFPPLGRLVEMNAQNKAGIFFVDELSTARGQSKDALLTLIQQGKIGDYYLNPRIRRVASMNPPEQTAGGEVIPPPVASRLIWLYFSHPTVAEFGEFLANGAQFDAVSEDDIIDVDVEEKRVLEAWNAHWPETVGMVSGWLQKQPQYLMKMPNLDDPAVSAAWPAPRSHATFARVLTAARIFDLNDLDTEILITGCIGSEAASAFSIWKHHNKDIPNIRDLLSGQATYTPDPARLDVSLAVISGCVAHLLAASPNDFARESRVFFRVCKQIAPFGGDLLMRPIKRIFAHASTLPGTTSASKEAQELLLQLYPILSQVV